MKFEKNPGKEYRSLPFWSLNGKLDSDELKAQIKVLKEMGFGGAFIHSRTGLATEYMSDEWLELVRECSETFAAEGMDAWLYDEDRWPSGTCGGYVTENPAYRRSFISGHIYGREEFDLAKFGPEYLASFAVKLVGEQYTDHAEDLPEYAGMRLADYFPATHFSQIPDGYLGMVFTVELADPDEFYNGYTYVDTMAKEPTELYLELTHAKYDKAMGEMFGDKIKGIFTDEPHRGAAFNGFGISNRNGYRMIPYTHKLFEEYKRRWGENLRDKLPELYFGSDKDNFSCTAWRYYEVLQELFLRNFVRPLYNWCRKHKMKFTGHMLHENSLASQATMSGSAMRFYEYTDYPGIDNLGTDDTCYSAAVAVSSVANQLGKKFVLSELYGCTGWKTTFEQYKQIGDWQAMLGVNLRCTHLSWYTMKGEAKRDYPASINKQANWHKEYRAVEDYFARLTRVMTSSKPLTSTLVVSPIESAWGLMHMGGFHSCFTPRDPEYRRLEEDFRILTEKMLFAGGDFDYGDEEIMSRKSESGADSNGAYISVGKMKYRELVLPETVTLRSSTLALVEKFISFGGKVYAVNRLPTHIDGKAASVCLAGAVIADADTVAINCGHAGKTYAKVESDGNFIYKLKRAGKDEYVCFVVNQDREHGHKAVITLHGGEYAVEKFDLRSGETVGIAYRHEGGNTVAEYDFALSEELMLHFTAAKVAPYAVRVTGEAVTPADAEMEYKLSRPNTLVLDCAKAYVDGEFFCEDEILRIDWRLRDKFEMTHRTGSMVQPWYKEKYCGGYASPVCKLRLEFPFAVEYIPEGEIKLMTESFGSCKLKLNGKLITVAPEQSETDECFSLLSVKDLIVQGDNVLECELDFSDSADLESFYLLGGFGVKAGNPCTVTKLPDRLRFGDVCTQGLPFYAGDVTYSVRLSDGEYECEANDFYAACLKSGGVTAAFAPYVMTVIASGGKAEITATLTPKNMFGPLHEVPAMRMICGPGDFHTAGADWSDDYALIPQGIFSAPVFKKIK